MNRNCPRSARSISMPLGNGVDLGDLLTSWQPAGWRGTSWRPFLHHIRKGQPHRGREVRTQGVPQAAEGADRDRGAVDPGCVRRLRDRFLFAVLYDSGIRIGEALGLRHEDSVRGEARSRGGAACQR